MRCPKCGTEIREGNSFCTGCGYLVRNIPKPKPKPEPKPEPKPGREKLEKTTSNRRPVNWQPVVIGVLATAVLLVGLYAVLGDRIGGRAGGESTAAAQPIQQAGTGTAIEEPTPEPTPTPEPEDYLLPNSSTEYLSESDLSGLTWEQLCFARNEVFARHGRMFNTPQIRAFFEGKDWYHPTIPAEQFDNNSLSAVEKANVQLISQYENSHYGGSYY